jgi:hypothetical protein
MLVEDDEEDDGDGDEDDEDDDDEDEDEDALSCPLLDTGAGLNGRPVPAPVSVPPSRCDSSPSSSAPAGKLSRGL